ncbi:MAG TPA: carbohydrate ABC transporter permease [Aggregatilineales bacterium]|nr:carbohydrate ABC transporter permease [Aggregatilineales bacterium]
MTTTSALQTVPAPSSAALRPLLRLGVRFLAYAILILFTLMMIMPFIYTITNSFKTLPDITANPQALLPTMGINTSGYERILAGDFKVWVLNSVIFAVFTMLAHLLFDSLAGYALARIRFPGRGIAFAGLLGLLMVPTIVLLIPRFLVLTQLHMVNTYWGLLLPTAADAFGIFLMKQFFESMPPDIEEAAFMDGASRFRMFFTIVLPMATPALTALAIFGFQGAWNDFTDPLIAVGTERSLYTLPLGLAIIQGNTGSALPFDLLLSGAVITTLPMAVIFFIFQRFFVEGVTYSGIKG